MKPFYSSKGRYTDNRQKIIIVEESKEGRKVKVMPKPEKMLEIISWWKSCNTKLDKDVLQYLKYLKKIKQLKEEYGLDAIQVLSLHLAASFKTNQLDYNKLKNQFIKNAKRRNIC